MTFIVPANFRQLPPVWEIAQPFNIDATGAVAYDTDPIRWAMNHILAILLTNPGERVMRSNYGVGIGRMVFENDSPFVEQQLVTAINQEASLYEQNVIINECQFIQQPDYSGTMALQVSFSVGGSPAVYAMTFSLGGTGVEITV